MMKITTVKNPVFTFCLLKNRSERLYLSTGDRRGKILQTTIRQLLNASWDLKVVEILLQQEIRAGLGDTHSALTALIRRPRNLCRKLTYIIRQFSPLNCNLKKKKEEKKENNLKDYFWKVLNKVITFASYPFHFFPKKIAWELDSMIPESLSTWDILWFCEL